MSTAALVAAAVFAAVPRIAVLPLNQGEGVNAQTTQSVGEALVAELRKLEAAELITARQMEAVLGIERQRELLGCTDESCLTELAGAMDVEQVVTGTLSRLGQSWLLQVQRLNARNAQVMAHAAVREQGGMDRLLDKLPAMAGELWVGLKPGSAPRPIAAPKPEAPLATPPAQALPPPYADVLYAEKLDRAALTLLTDGQGRYVAVKPFAVSGPHFAGDKDALYLQRIRGGGSEGDKSYSFSFWEPRVNRGAEAYFQLRDGKYLLTCGKKTVPLQPVPAAQAKKLLAAAKLYDVRWQRQAYAFARDDDGNWYLADQARLPEGNEDFRLYLGEPGELRAYAAKALARDQAGEIFRAADGRLKIDRQKREAEWIAGDARRKLTLLDPSDHVTQIYGQGGPYRGMPLGTLCDGRF